MPELPEVETICRGMQRALEGGTIQRVELRRPDLRFPFPPGFAAALQGRKLVRLARRAKYIQGFLDDGQVWLLHLGMSGRVCLHEGEQTAEQPHDHVRMLWEQGGVVHTLIYRDPRRFGFMALAKAEGLEAHPLFAHLGPEPLSNHFHADYLYARLQRRKGPVKPALMDQQLVVGVGNIYASEALYRAQIRPDRPANTVSKVECEALRQHIRDVLTDAIAAGGSSLRDYVDADGSAGYFQHRFDVYGRAGEPCHACGGQIQHLRQSGRASFYCAACQD